MKLTPWERRRIMRRVQRKFYREVLEEVEDMAGEPIPLALAFDLGLTEMDKVILHGLGVEA